MSRQGPDTMETQTYLGDGLYASFDGYQIWLKASNGVTVTNAVALEPAVFAALVAYEKKLRDMAKAAANTHAPTNN